MATIDYHSHLLRCFKRNSFDHFSMCSTTYEICIFAMKYQYWHPSINSVFLRTHDIYMAICISCTGSNTNIFNYWNAKVQCQMFVKVSVECKILCNKSQSFPKQNETFLCFNADILSILPMFLVDHSWLFEIPFSFRS